MHIKIQFVLTGSPGWMKELSRHDRANQNMQAQHIQMTSQPGLWALFALYPEWVKGALKQKRRSR